MAKKDLKNTANFLYEVGIMSKTPRSGFYLMCSGQQSVAEHTNRTVYAGFVLAVLDGKADPSKVMQMCLFHDLAEARTSDLNYVHQKYAISDEEKAIKDLAKTLNFGDKILEILKEYQQRKSKEAILAKDADNLDWLLSLREEVDKGNTKAKSWIPSVMKRFKTKVAKDLAQAIEETPSDDWWFSNKEDEWWVSRNKHVTKKRW